MLEDYGNDPTGVILAVLADDTDGPAGYECDSGYL